MTWPLQPTLVPSKAEFTNAHAHDALHMSIRMRLPLPSRNICSTAFAFSVFDNQGFSKIIWVLQGVMHTATIENSYMYLSSCRVSFKGSSGCRSMLAVAAFTNGIADARLFAGRSWVASQQHLLAAAE